MQIKIRIVEEDRSGEHVLTTYSDTSVVRALLGVARAVDPRLNSLMNSRAKHLRQIAQSQGASNASGSVDEDGVVSSGTR
jgi:hypothetical protein